MTKQNSTINGQSEEKPFHAFGRVNIYTRWAFVLPSHLCVKYRFDGSD